MSSEGYKLPALPCKLAGQAHYTVWRDLASDMLKVYDLWKVVDGSSTRPTFKETITSAPAVTEAPGTTTDDTEDPAVTSDNSEEILNWDKKDTLAKVFLKNNFEFDLIVTISPSTTANELWTQLEERFDRKTVALLHSLLATITTLQYSPDKSMKYHLTEFTTLWSTLLLRTSNSTDETRDPLGYHLHSIARVSQIKASFLLLSLRHQSLEHVVDNFQSKENITYEEIYEKLMDLDGRRSNEHIGGEAYNMRTGRPNPYNKSKRTSKPRHNSNQNKSDNICTWCTKNGDYAKGHTHRECRKLKAFREKERSAASGNVASGTAFVTWSNLPTLITKLSEPLVLEEDELISLPDVDMTDAYAFTSGTTPSDSCAWIFDPGATNHMTGTQVPNPTPYTGTVTVGGGRKLKVTGIGKVHVNGSYGPITLENVFVIPELGHVNLMSWSCIARKGFTTTGNENGFTIYSTSGNDIIGKAKANGSGLYIFETKDATAHNTVATTFFDWHQRLGHMPASSLSRLRNMVADPKSLPTTGNMETCNTCELAKSTKNNLASLTEPRSRKPLELIHSDLSGKFSTTSLGGFSYYITFIDDHTRFAHVYFLKSKSDAADAIKRYIAYMENQMDTTIKRFRSDNGGEYIPQNLKNFFLSKGIKHELTVPYSHESNGIAERFNQTIANMARCALLDRELPKSLWAEAINMMVHVKNRLPHSALTNMTPYEAFHGRKPFIGHLRIFGETMFVHTPVEARPAGSKLDARATTGQFCGYGDSDKICHVYLLLQRKVVLSRHFRFKGPSVGEEINIPVTTDTPTKQPKIKIEPQDPPKKDSYKDEASMVGAGLTRPNTERPPTTHYDSDTDNEKLYDDDDIQLQILRETQEYFSENEEDEEDNKEHASKVGAGITRPTTESLPIEEEEIIANQPRRNPARERKAPERYGHNTISDQSPLNEPTTYHQAITSPDSDKWKQAMKIELDSLARNNTWKMVQVPENRKLVDSKWVYKIKLGPDGNPTRYKARLVAKGFSQIPGQDFDQTFAPVSRYETIRLLLARSLQTGGKCDQMDVTSAFLYGELKEEIYMKPPPGYQPTDKACKLIKCIYGLKQSSREWYAKLSSALIKMGFKKADFDPCVFIHKTGEVVIAIYVDDILIFYWNTERKNRVSLQLHAEFEMTEAGTASWALGIHLIHTKTGIILSQEAYLKRVLIKYGFADSRPVATPIDHNVTLQKGTPEEQIDDPTLYQSIIGSLMYAVIGTRPDLAYTVTMLSQYSSCPTEIHLTAVKRVLRYLKGTLDWCLHYNRTRPTALIGYSDASYASDVDDRRSFTGHCFMLGEALISWRSYKQRSVATSTTFTKGLEKGKHVLFSTILHCYSRGEVLK